MFVGWSRPKLKESPEAFRDRSGAVLGNRSPVLVTLDRLFEGLPPTAAEKIVERDLAERTRFPQTFDEQRPLPKVPALDSHEGRAIDDTLRRDTVTWLRENKIRRAYQIGEPEISG